MDKAWQQERQKWYDAEIQRRKEAILEGIKNCDFINEAFQRELIEMFNAVSNNRRELFSFGLKLTFGSHNVTLDGKAIGNAIKYDEWVKSLGVDDYKCMIEYADSYNGMSYLDNEPMEFDGDIIITDPCYITKDSDWHKCCCGDNMEVLGINHYMTRDTLYGDWSCTTYNTDTKEKIGSFCADAGLVSVFLLDEVLKYNPDYKYENDWSVTYIKDFKGTVQFVVVYTDGYYEDETEYHKKGEHWEDYSVEVVGHGINKVTGEPINFVGRQTGL